MSDNSKMKTVRTICRECGEKCGMLVQVKDGRAIKLEEDPSSPKSLDKLCWKAAAGLERLYHPDRLQVPLKRAGGKGEGKWEEISWEEALTTIADKFNTIKETSGAESVALVKGHYDRRCDLVSRLGNSFGTPNIASIDNTCYIPSASGRLMTYGFDGRPDFSGHPDCIMCWGSSSLPPLSDAAKLIVVNSIQTEAAKRSDIWLQPRPGSDLALALAILNVIVNEALYDKEFVANWTVGFNELKQHIQQYAPEQVAEITWVPAEKIVSAARLFAEYSHACLHIGNASEDTYNSTQFARTISIIQAVCGLLDIPGGTIQSRGNPIDYEGSAADTLCDILPPEQQNKKLGSNFGHFPADPLWDTIVNKPAELQPQYLVDSILEKTPYQVQAALVIACNPVMTWCNSKRVFEAFSKIPFLAVSELFMTPTANLADIVLPAASYLETDAVAVGHLGFGDTTLQAQQKTVQIGQCKSDMEIIIALAHKLGLSHYFWKDTPSYLDDHLKDVGITFNELCRYNRIIPSGTQYRKYLQGGFNTPSGKVEIVSSLCEKWGYETLPTYHELRETPFSDPELEKTYPLVLTSAHDKNYAHSQDRNLRVIRDRVPKPLVAIHPNTAATLGIAEGDQVIIENLRGRIKQFATLSEEVDPRVINVAYGWWFPERDISFQYGWDEANINILTDDSPPYSPEIGSPSMRGFLCRVYKADESVNPEMYK
jgi:anaerobic selenocysteine-containing dehydrogenase